MSAEETTADSLATVEAERDAARHEAAVVRAASGRIDPDLALRLVRVPDGRRADQDAIGEAVGEILERHPYLALQGAPERPQVRSADQGARQSAPMPRTMSEIIREAAGTTYRRRG